MSSTVIPCLRCRDAPLLISPRVVELNGCHTVAGSHSIEEEAAMGLFSKDIKTLDDLFLHGLQDIYYAEQQIVEALPKMVEKAKNARLKQGLQTHLGETKNQIKRLEQVFEMYGQEAQAKKCPSIDGLLKEGEEVMGDVADDDVLNVAMIGAAQSVEHYEISRYGTLIAWAEQLRRRDCAGVLKKNLAEEKATDKKLTAMAEGQVNPRAAPPARRRSRAKSSRATGRSSAAKSKRKSAARRRSA
jgi:ferritin-like metal-binding protein YciE